MSAPTNIQLAATDIKKNVLDLNIEESHLMLPKVKVAVKRYATVTAIAIAAAQNKRNLISFDTTLFINRRFSSRAFDTTVDLVRQFFRIPVGIINYAKCQFI